MITRFEIRNGDDLNKIAGTFADNVWGTVALEDRNKRPWLLVEDDHGELYMHGADEDGYTEAEFILDYYGPLVVLSDAANEAVAK